MGAGAAPSASGAGVYRPLAGDFLHLPVERDIDDPHGPAGHTRRRSHRRSPDSRLNRSSGRVDFGDRNVFLHAHFRRGESPEPPNGIEGDNSYLVGDMYSISGVYIGVTSVVRWNDGAALHCR